jgi:hypothetical protein
MFPEETVCSVLGVQPGMAPAAALAVGVVAAIAPPELELPQPATATLAAASAANPKATRFTYDPYPTCLQVR